MTDFHRIVLAACILILSGGVIGYVFSRWTKLLEVIALVLVVLVGLVGLGAPQLGLTLSNLLDLMLCYLILAGLVAGCRFYHRTH
jgi:hypothetical protein